MTFDPNHDTIDAEKIREYDEKQDATKEEQDGEST